jgi:hypothetical protein
MFAVDLSLMAVDVDGSLANPVMRIAVIAWGIALAAPLVVVFRYTAAKWQRIGAVLAVLVSGTILSPFANRAIAILAYRMVASNPGVSVGFFGGPTIRASPFVALAVTGCVTLYMGRRK